MVLKLVNFLFLTLQEPQGIKNAQPDLENGGKLITTFVLKSATDCIKMVWFGLIHQLIVV